MSTVLTNGIIIPDNGSRNWGGDLANNWNILDVNVGYMTDVKTRVTTLESSVAENTANIQTNASSISALQTSKQDVLSDQQIANIADVTNKANTSDLSAVATSGSYNDLTDKPTIPTVNSDGISYFDPCSELWLVNRKLDSYNTTPTNEIDTQIWFTDKNSNKYATLQTDYYADGIRQFALTHKSLRTDSWIGLSMKTSTTDDFIQCQPRFQAIDSIVVHSGTNLHKFTYIYEGWIEMSNPDDCCIDFKHETSQDYVGRIGLSPENILYLETINGAPIMANGKNIVRSVNGVNADSNGNVNIQAFSDAKTRAYAYKTTMTTATMYVGSVLTSNGKAVSFVVPMNISGSPAISFTKLRLRYDGKFLFGSTEHSDVTTSYTFTATVFYGGLNVVINFSDADAHAINNSCIVSEIQLKLTY